MADYPVIQDDDPIPSAREIRNALIMLDVTWHRGDGTLVTAWEIAARLREQLIADKLERQQKLREMLHGKEE